MYISKLPLNSARRGAMELIASPNKMHAAVEHAFPPREESGSAQGRILWRLDIVPRGSEDIWLYVVSPDKPDFTHICERAGWPTLGTWETKDYAPLLDRIADGQVWSFRLKANPVRKVSKDLGTQKNENVVGKIQGHVTEQQQLKWLLSRCEEHGFSVASDSAGAPAVRLSQRAKGAFLHKGSHVTLTTVVYDGTLVVLDAEKFRRTLCYGMGRAKGFGCGLLTVAPARAIFR
ncbi:MAG: type I-E CRISPR-associated protein Cas6/Cse3/CasE [Coriobacteriia bacterium]|nr:type I-E CRISPR-associated protein Cas6/Cse3/CasE [Coriobacteriia bacterium]MBS5478410.1 type I-E CRISPR-associated protein Cas6/Cse3/CasE [Coriobacteriia bacterium]